MSSLPRRLPSTFGANDQIYRSIRQPFILIGRFVRNGHEATGERKKIESESVLLAFRSRAKGGSCSLISSTSSERMSASVSTILVQKPVLGSPETKFVETAVTCDDRFAAMHLLAKHRIDYLAILSPWPETFSFVAHEGIASGCALLCLRDSGNVAALVDRTDQGVVFDDMKSLCDFLETPAFSLRAERRKRCFQILEVGTTATYPFSH